MPLVARPAECSIFWGTENRITQQISDVIYTYLSPPVLCFVHVHVQLFYYYSQSLRQTTQHLFVAQATNTRVALPEQPVRCLILGMLS